MFVLHFHVVHCHRLRFTAQIDSYLVRCLITTYITTTGDSSYKIIIKTWEYVACVIYRTTNSKTTDQLRFTERAYNKS